MTRLHPNSTRLTTTRVRAAVAAVAVAAAVLVSPAFRQGVPPCSSGCQALGALQGKYCVDGLANENGQETPTTHVFAWQCATTLHVSHALHFTPPSAPFTFTHVCIGLVGGAYGSATTYNDPSVVLYA